MYFPSKMLKAKPHFYTLNKKIFPSGCNSSYVLVYLFTCFSRQRVHTKDKARGFSLALPHLF